MFVVYVADEVIPAFESESLDDAMQAAEDLAKIDPAGTIIWLREGDEYTEWVWSSD